MSAPPKKPGRNSPCPCGSGKKYKKCHMAEDRARAGQVAKAGALVRIATQLNLELFEFALDRFGPAWGGAALSPFEFPDDAMELVLPYAVHHSPAEGRSVGDWYLDERGARLSPDQRSCLRAEREAWLSLWEVVEVEPGVGFLLRDLLSQEERRIVERTASETLVKRDCVLVRVIELEGTFYLDGLYPRALSPDFADEVARLARGHLRRKHAVPVERLRGEKFCRYLIRRFEEAVWEAHDRAGQPPELTNNDGDAFVITTDHFDIEPGALPEVEATLAGMDGVDAPEPGTPGDEYGFIREDSVIVGRAWIRRGKLHVETNSRERADALRARIEEACAGLIRHRIREHADPLSEARESALGLETGAPPRPAEILALEREFKERHYAEWVDTEIPALDGATPRAAVRTREGREQLGGLLRQMEHMEQQMPEAQRFDFDRIWRELGLEDR